MADDLSSILQGVDSRTNALQLSPEQIDALQGDISTTQAKQTQLEAAETSAAGDQFTQQPPQQDAHILDRLAPLLLFSAFGGKLTKINASAMLGATTGMVKGYIAGDAQAYQQHLDTYNAQYQQFKDRRDQQDKIFKEMREAYKGRIDADIKALQFARQVTGDEGKVDAQILSIKSRMDDQAIKLAVLDERTNHDRAMEKIGLQKAQQSLRNGQQLDNDAIDLLAANYLATRQLPYMGMGQSPARVQILNRAADMAKANGDNASSVIIKQSAIKSAQTALTDQTKRSAVMGQQEQTAVANLDLAVAEGQKTDRAGSPLANSAIIAWKQGVTGDPQTARFVNALTVARTEYEKVISGATGASGITDAARREGEQLFSKISNQQTLEEQVAIAKQEMKNRMKGFESQKQILTDTIGQNVEPTGGAPKPPAPTDDLAAMAKAELERRKKASAGSQ